MGQAEDDQGASTLVGNNLIGDHLSEKRGGEADQLNGEESEEDVPPDFFVLEQFGDKPGKIESLFLHRETGDKLFVAGGGFLADQNELGIEPLGCLGGGDGFRGLRADAKIEELLPLDLEDNEQSVGWGIGCRGRAGLRRRQKKTDGWQGQFLPIKTSRGPGAGLESQGTSRLRLVQDCTVIGRRKGLRHQGGIKRQTIEPVRAA